MQPSPRNARLLAASLCGFVFSVFADKSLCFSATSVALKELMVSPLSERPLLALLDFRYRDIEYSFALREFRYRDIENIAIFGNGSDTVIVENRYRDISIYRNIEQP